MKVLYSINDKFEEVLEQRLQEKYWKEYSDINDVNGLMTVWGDLFEEMKNIVTELAGQEWITNEEFSILILITINKWYSDSVS